MSDEPTPETYPSGIPRPQFLAPDGDPVVLIVTGMSGAGRTRVAASLGDLGWYVVDNMPPQLLGGLVSMIGKNPTDRLAAVVDVRGREFFQDLEAVMDELTDRGVHVSMLFLESNDKALVRRFEEARRPHPLQGEGTLLEGIEAERAMLARARSRADHIVDTSELNVYELRDRIIQLVGHDEDGVRVNIVSFGFKNGIPADADFLADVRFLPNPHWVPELRDLTGLDPVVRESVLASDGAGEFVEQYARLLEFALARYTAEDKPFVTVGVGCTGGKHRSVAIAEALGQRLESMGVMVRVTHRDRERFVTGSVVALGGGHGLYSSLTALRSFAHNLTAIVTVADDGGSSGMLRDEMGIVPPGDLRMALAALCEDTEWGRTWRDILQTRFHTDGPLDGHSVGNLLIAAAWTHTGDVVEGLDWIGRLLRSEGRVLPLAEEPLEISAVTQGAEGTQTVRGQVAVASAAGTIASLEIRPHAPKVPQATLDAIAHADLVVLGPGSWYTSVLTHFLVEPVARALTEAGPRCVVVLNIAHEDQETAGTDRVDDIRALRAVAPDFRPAVVLAHSDDAQGEALVDCVADWGARLMVAPMLQPGTRDRHELGALAVQLELASESIIRGTRGPRSMAG